jgi:general secretion pathway protein G
MLRKKSSITLLEIMIVISLIAIIGGVLSYNMKGSLDKGRAFKTEKAQEQINDILQLELNKGDATPQEIEANPAGFLERSELVKKSKELIKDGWGVEMKVEYKNGNFIATSAKLDEYQKKEEAKSKTHPAKKTP